jgi:hypothetical protein
MGLPSQNWKSGSSVAIKKTYLPPLESKGIYHSLHAVNHPMRLLGYLNAAFPCWTFGAIEYKERKKWLREKLCKSEEDEAKLRILAFPTTLCVKEPNASVRTESSGSLAQRVAENEPSVYTNTISSQARHILLKTIDNSQVCEGARLRRMLDKLRKE